MKIYSVFNSSRELLATFTDEPELFRFIQRHKRCVSDTKILTSTANDWNEFENPRNETGVLMHKIWTDPALFTNS